jgi:N-acetylglucosaminyldiphosphoundecaprenol N-acetyl-beta-D-mannosaminyltransferase
MEHQPITLRRVNLLGVGVANISLDQAADLVLQMASSPDRHYVCISNVHTVMMCHEDEAYRRIHNEASMVTPDGMPLAWMERLLGYHQTGRVYGPDLMLAVCERSVATGHRHYFYGGEEGVPEELTRVLEKRYPGIRIVGGYSPPFRPLTPEEDAAAVQRINDSGADLLWVGLGAPKQERWMADHYGRIHAPVMLGVGAAFPFHTGRVRQAPAFLQAIAMEWAFRLAMEPKRLWRRYFYYNPLFLLYAGLQLAGLKKYTLNATPKHVTLIQ